MEKFVEELIQKIKSIEAFQPGDSASHPSIIELAMDAYDYILKDFPPNYTLSKGGAEKINTLKHTIDDYTHRPDVLDSEKEKSALQEFQTKVGEQLRNIFMDYERFKIQNPDK